MFNVRFPGSEMTSVCFLILKIIFSQTVEKVGSKSQAPFEQWLQENHEYVTKSVTGNKREVWFSEAVNITVKHTHWVSVLPHAPVVSNVLLGDKKMYAHKTILINPTASSVTNCWLPDVQTKNHAHVASTKSNRMPLGWSQVVKGRLIVSFILSHSDHLTPSSSGHHWPWSDWLKEHRSMNENHKHQTLSPTDGRDILYMEDRLLLFPLETQQR